LSVSDKKNFGKNFGMTGPSGHISAEFPADSGQKPTIENLKIQDFEHFGANLRPFFFKTQFGSRIDLQSLKIVCMSFFITERWFLFIFEQLFANFRPIPGRNRQLIFIKYGIFGILEEIWGLFFSKFSCGFWVRIDWNLAECHSKMSKNHL